MESDSKLGMYESRASYIGQQDLGFNHLYRALDVLADKKEDIEVYLFEQNKNLFNMTVDVVFYDVTTIYFESQNEDVIRKYGFSKDGKINRVQIVLGLLVDKEGRPIGYDLFSGNTFDVKTLKPVLERMKKRFSIDKVIVVADRGINSKLNLLSLRELGYGYIVAMRLKGIGKELLDEVFKDEGYREIIHSDEIFKYKSIPYIHKIKNEDGLVHEIQDTVVISYSSKRAQKDAYDRERLIEKAIKMLEEPTSITAANKRGGKRYITSKDQINWQLDIDRIKEDERFDGYYAIQSSEKWLTAEQVLEAYHNLWKIEESFRIMKSTLQVRPIFHWTERRIRGHFVVCFMSFLLMRTLQQLLKGSGKDNIAADRIRDALRDMVVTEVKIAERDYYIRHKLSEIQKLIMRKLKAKIPENLTAAEDFSI
ncbi:hypothetical protein JCM13991_18550 [Thermodesulfovibrio hydrogeniphilus]